MFTLKKRYKKWLSVLIILALLSSTFIVTNGTTLKIDRSPVNGLSKDDKQIVNDISNMTGVKAEEIIKLKNQGITWNEVLDKLKKVEITTQNDRNTRNTVLSETGVDDNIIKKLKSEGVTDEEITKAKMLIERVMLQLSEITTPQDGNTQQLPSASSDADKQNEDDVYQYTELSGKIDAKTAIYLILKLSKDFGTMENAFDEYLLSLQIGVNLEKYIIDQKAYEKEKSEKIIGVDSQKIITLAKIEEKMLKQMQRGSTGNRRNGDIETGSGKSNDASKPEAILPELPMPDVGDTRPQNPTDDVMKEVNDIRDKSLNIGIAGKGR